MESTEQAELHERLVSFRNDTNDIYNRVAAVAFASSVLSAGLTWFTFQLKVIALPALKVVESVKDDHRFATYVVVIGMAAIVFYFWQFICAVALHHFYMKRQGEALGFTLLHSGAAIHRVDEPVTRVHIDYILSQWNAVNLFQYGFGRKMNGEADSLHFRPKFSAMWAIFLWFPIGLVTVCALVYAAWVYLQSL
jgi:hypothetical protein